MFTISIYTLSYYLIEIRPHDNFINEKIKTYSELSKNHLLLEKMAIKEETQNGILRYAAHSLAVDNIKHGFRNYWHLIGLHWHLWIWIRYTDNEIFQLWLAMVPNGSGRGMNEASMFYFNSKIEDLSCNQLAQLVVMVRSPSMFKPGSDRSNKRIKNKGIISVCNS